MRNLSNRSVYIDRDAASYLVFICAPPRLYRLFEVLEMWSVSVPNLWLNSEAYTRVVSLEARRVARCTMILIWNSHEL